MKDRTDAYLQKIAKRRAINAVKAQRARHRKGARTYKAIKAVSMDD